MSRNAIGLEDAVLVDNKIWFCLSDYKSLVSMDIRSKKNKVYTIQSEGKYDDKRAFGSVKEMGNKIYLLPYYAREIMCFDIETEKFQEIKIDAGNIERGKAFLLGTGVYQNYLFATGVDVPVILRLNTLDNHIDYITGWQQEAEKYIFNSDIFFRKQCVVVDNRLFVPFCNANAVLEIDCITLKTVIHSMGLEKQGYSGLLSEGKLLWLSPRNGGNVVKWDIEAKKIYQIKAARSINTINSLTYIGIIMLQNKKLLLPIVEKKEHMLDIASKHKIREYTDVTQRLISHWQICSGNFAPRKAMGKMFHADRSNGQMKK